MKVKNVNKKVTWKRKTEEREEHNTYIKVDIYEYVKVHKTRANNERRAPALRKTPARSQSERSLCSFVNRTYQ